MIILGLTWSHDSHAAIIKNGKILSSVGEERISRIKNHYGFPYKAIDEVIRLSKINVDEIDLVAISNTMPYSSYLNDLYFNYKKQIDRNNESSFLINLLRLKHYLLKFFQNKKDFDRYYFEKVLKKALEDKKIQANYKCFDHHLCHASSAFYSSGFKDSFIAIIDQYGDDKCISFWKGINNEITLLKSYNDYASPGAFYSEITHFLGYKRYRHEGKITGLSARGNPKVLSKRLENLLKFNPKSSRFTKNKIIIKKKNIIQKLLYGWIKYLYKMPYGPIQKYYLKNFKKIFKNKSKEDISAAAQYVLEKFTLNIIKHNSKKFKCENICLAGGTTANVLVNQKIFDHGKYDNIFIFPNMGDGGLAVGAAQYAFFKNNPKKEKSRVNSFFLGGKPNISNIEYEINKFGFKYEKFNSESKQVHAIAELIVKNKIVGLVRDKMEFGPRALCHRSIICSPTDNNINTTLNKRLNRTEFMPFAPVIIKENFSKIFPNLKCKIPTKFMTITVNVNKNIKKLIPAVVHIDGTARPQIVSKSSDKFMHSLLVKYEEITNIPALINTSFNAHEEPIVYTTDDALRSFKYGSVDHLVIENYIISKIK